MGSQGGWEWSHLQEAYARTLRNREKDRLSVDENEELWQEELSAKDDQIATLIAELNASRSEAVTIKGGGVDSSDFVIKMGRECYQGEAQDRLRAAVAFCAEKGEDAGWDARSLAMFQAALEASEFSGGAKTLRTELQKATRDAKRLAGEVTALLCQHGYEKKSEKNHVRLEARPGLSGLATVTIPKTPSDGRGQKNLKSQIEATLGLRLLL